MIVIPALVESNSSFKDWLTDQFESVAEFNEWAKDSLTESELCSIFYDPQFFLRPKPMLPQMGEASVWSVEAGRGHGKTELGSGNINDLARDNPGMRIGLMGDTLGEVVHAMLYGPSGIIERSHPDFVPIYNEKARELLWPNGSIAHTFSGDEPEQLRSRQFHLMWIDELYKMRYQRQIWEQVQYVMRLTWQPGFKTWKQPITINTSTPRPTLLCREIRGGVASGETILTLGSTFDNARNLDKKFLRRLSKLKGTRTGDQELFGALLEDNPDALFSLELIERNRYELKIATDGDSLEKQVFNLLKRMDKVVVAVDPATSDGKKSDETGIVVCGRRGDEGYVFDDLSIKGPPSKWAKAVAKAYTKYDADWCVYESNQGGLLVEEAIRNVDRTIKTESVRAIRDKAERASPVSILYEQGIIHHVGVFSELETQMIEFNPTLGRNQKSPDRMDALVWGLTKLFGESFGQQPRLYNIRGR